MGSIVLLLAATALLAVGVVQEGLGPVYLSLACSTAAGVVLFAAVKVARRSSGA